jgi:hypothetical protein
VASPVCLTDGNDGLLYGIGANGGFAVINPVARTVASYVIDDLSGTSVAVTNLPGQTNLFLARDTSGDSMVDVLDPTTRTLLANLTVPVVGTPVDIADGPDTLLYVLGGGGNLAWLDATGNNTGSISLGHPSGDYVGLTSRAGSRLLYLVRDTSSDTQVDTYDVDSQQVVFGLSAFSTPGSPCGITDGPDDHLYILGIGGGGAAGFAEIDPADGSLVLNHLFMDFLGDNVALTNLVVETVVAVEGAPPLAIDPFPHLAAPNPFNAQVEIRFEATGATAAYVSVYDLRGRLVCTLQDKTSAPGWRRVAWNGCDRGGVPVPSGTYLYRIEGDGQTAEGKIQLTK